MGKKEVKKPTEQEMRTITGVIKGQTAKNGTVINSIRYHAHCRIKERGYSGSHILNVMQTGEQSKGTEENSTAFDKGNLRVVINDKIGELITIIRLRRNRPRNQKKG